MKIDNVEMLVGTPVEFKSLQERLACLYYSLPTKEVQELYKRSWDGLRDGFISLRGLDVELVQKLFEKAYTEYNLMCYCRYMCKKNKLVVLKTQNQGSEQVAEIPAEKQPENNVPEVCMGVCKGCRRADILKKKEEARAADAKAIASGEKTAEQVNRENAFFRGKNALIDFDGIEKLV